MNAVIYARYSSLGQNEQSIEGQLKDCRAYAERAGFAVIGEYVDKAKSARSDDRPDFQRMIRAVERRQFQIILVWKLDRFARNRYDSAIYKARLKKHGVRVISATENITEGPEGIILEGMLEAMAEYYSANLSQNVLRGQRETAAKGRWCGGSIPYGYMPADGRLVANERTAPIIQEVFRRYAAGERMSIILSDLNARGVRGLRGRPVGDTTFKAALSNPTYIGRHTRRGEVIEGCADALIDEETFMRVQSQLKRRAKAPAAAKAKVDYLLQGKAYCGHCGAPMIGESGYGRNGAQYHYYACATRKKSHGCEKRNERKEALEEMVVRHTLEYVLSPDRMDAIAEAVVAEYDREFNADGVHELERQLARIEGDLNTLTDDLLSVPKATKPRIYARMELLEAQRADLELDIARARIAARIRYTADEVRAWLQQFCGGNPSDPAFQLSVIGTFVNSAYLYDDKVVTFYNMRGGKQVTYADLPGSLDEPPGSDLSGLIPPGRLKSEPLYVFVNGILGCVVRR